MYKSLPDVSSAARGINFDLSLHLHPYFVYVSSGGSGEYVLSRKSYVLAHIVLGL